MGPVRVLDVERRLFLVVADAPLSRYGEDAVNRGLADLDWVSRAALAHEAVVESFIETSAVLPMKLFTMFTSDERALAYVRGERKRIAAAARRVANHHEWGVRVIFDRTRAVDVAASRHAGPGRATSSPKQTGADYLARKKAQRDAGVERTAHAREAIAHLYQRLAARATVAKKKAQSELPVQGGPLLLDAAFLVARSRARSFQSTAAAEAKVLARRGYGLTLSGPWPPYSFVGE